MGETAPVSIPKIKYAGFTSKTLVSNSLANVTRYKQNRM